MSEIMFHVFHLENRNSWILLNYHVLESVREPMQKMRSNDLCHADAGA